MAVLRDQEDECERLAGTLYTKGLTQEQVGEVFADIYGEHYIKASISRMLDYLREDVSQWLSRSLESYYPIVFIDCVHIKIHRKRSVDTEAFYVILSVKEDKTREVLGIYNKPTESATGWGEMLQDLYERGVGKVGLICADGLKGLEDVICEVFPGTKLQRCTTHLKRNIVSDVRQRGPRERWRMTCGRCSGPGTGTTRSRKPGENGRHSARSGESITVASGNADRIPPTRHTSRI